MRIFRLLFCVTACLFIFPEIYSQYYNLTFRNFSSSNGLSQSEVQSIKEDKYGFIWIGTRFGLTRYDGKEFRTFYHLNNNPNSLGENIVTDIEQDSKGILWFALYNSGISEMNGLNFTFKNIRVDTSGVGLKSDKVTELAIDKKDHIWIGSETGLTRYDPVRKTFKHILNLPLIRARNYCVSAIETDSSGNILLATERYGLFLIKNETEKISPLIDSAITGVINDVHIDRKGRIWVASSRGLFILQPNQKDKYILNKAPVILNEEVVVDLETDENDNLWMATSNRGLLIYFQAEGYLEEVEENYTTARGLLSNRLSCIFKDSRGGIWVGGENGLQTFHNGSQKFNIYSGLSNISNHLRGSTIYGIYEIDNDFILATSGGMLVYNRITNQFITIKNEHEAINSVIRFRAISREGDNVWWITSDRGIFELVKEDGNYILKRPSQFENMSLFKTESFRNYVKIDDDDIWFATTNNGIVHYNTLLDKTERFYHDPGNKEGLGDNIINKIAKDKENNILIGHDNGLSIYNPREYRFRNFGDARFHKKNALSSRYVYDIYDDDSTYWIATYGGGLNALNKKTGEIKYYTSADGLCNDAIYSIVAEGDSVFWLSTNKGLSRFKIADKNFQNFNQNDGLPADEFNMLSEFVNSDGEIFMATINGVISFHPQKLSHSRYQPRVYLAKIRVSGEYLSDSITGVINRDRKMIVQYDEDLFLEFSPLIYANNLNLSIRYKLNQGGEWKVAQSGTLLPLLKVEPGNYKMEVQLIDNNNEINSDTWKLNLVILPPYWKTVTFRVSVFLLIALISFFIIRTYIQRRLEKQRILFEREQAVEKERARISGELHDDIGGGLTAIRLLSEMNKDRSPDETSRIFFGKISASSNELIQKMNEIVWALNVNHDNLQSLIAYTRQFAVSYLDDFQIKCNVLIPDQIPDMPVMGNKRRDVFLLVKEALNNVAKHSKATAVTLELKISDRLQIEVNDNGKGMHGQQVRPGSHGLSNMRKRVENLGGHMTIENNQGTAVLFDIPLKDLAEISRA